MSEKANPRPWVLIEKGEMMWPASVLVLGHGIGIRQSDGAFDDIQSEAECKANAELIVRAVNAHDDLVAALEEIAKGSGSFSTDPLTHAANCIEEMKACACAALAKAAK